MLKSRCIFFCLLAVYEDVFIQVKWHILVLCKRQLLPLTWATVRALSFSWANSNTGSQTSNLPRPSSPWTSPQKEIVQLLFSNLVAELVPVHRTPAQNTPPPESEGWHSQASWVSAWPKRAPAFLLQPSEHYYFMKEGLNAELLYLILLDCTSVSNKPETV